MEGRRRGLFGGSPPEKGRLTPLREGVAVMKAVLMWRPEEGGCPDGVAPSHSPGAGTHGRPLKGWGYRTELHGLEEVRPVCLCLVAG